jgi:hypothetical protein
MISRARLLTDDVIVRSNYDELRTALRSCQNNLLRACHALADAHALAVQEAPPEEWEGWAQSSGDLLELASDEQPSA